MADPRIIRFDIEGNSEVKTIIKNPNRTDWDCYIRPEWQYVSSTGELETVVDDLNRVLIDTKQKLAEVQKDTGGL